MTTMRIGNNKKEMLRAVQNLSGHYDQTILIGHPFFIKDVIESGAAEGIKWAKKNLGLMFCSEGFSEGWRGYIAQKAGLPKFSKRIFNTYGSSEMLLMGYETEFSIGIKRAVEEDPTLLHSLSGDTIAPQFFQYHPLIRHIESVNRELVFSLSGAAPLVRFNLHDRGEVFSLGQIKSVMGGPKPKYAWPVVALWGRSDDTIKLHGVNLYPEHIKAGLMAKRFMRLLTGKFVIQKKLGRDMDQRWEINIELSQGTPPKKTLAKEIQTSVTETLRKINLEYLDMSSHVKKDVRPHIKLWPYQHSRYFKPGLKPRYINHN
jgi:phenylacetate-CoA ligase